MVEPHALGQRRMQHRRVVGLVDRAECRSEGSDAGVAIDLQVENFDSEGISRLSTLNVERAGERIVPFGQAESVTGLFDYITETVKRIGVENIAGVQSRNRLGGREKGLHIVGGGGVVNNILG